MMIKDIPNWCRFRRATISSMQPKAYLDGVVWDLDGVGAWDSMENRTMWMVHLLQAQQCFSAEIQCHYKLLVNSASPFLIRVSAWQRLPNMADNSHKQIGLKSPAVICRSVAWTAESSCWNLDAWFNRHVHWLCRTALTPVGQPDIPPDFRPGSAANGRDSTQMASMDSEDWARTCFQGGLHAAVEAQGVKDHRRVRFADDCQVEVSSMKVYNDWGRWCIIALLQP